MSVTTVHAPGGAIVFLYPWSWLVTVLASLSLALGVWTWWRNAGSQLQLASAMDRMAEWCDDAVARYPDGASSEELRALAAEAREIAARCRRTARPRRDRTVPESAVTDQAEVGESA